jgi:hypothetical protein
MIPDVKWILIRDVILHGFGAFRRGSIRAWERVGGNESIMFKRQPSGIPGPGPGGSRMTRYIVCNQAVSTATGTNRHVPPILRLP